MAANEEMHAQEDFLVEDFLAVETPEGYKAELIDGEIVVQLVPGGGHDKDIGKIVRRVHQKSDTQFDFWGNKGLITPSGGRCPKNHVIPDGTFVREEAALFNGDEPWSPAEGIDMVVEVTGARAEIDREAKRRCYARAEIPLYLLVDRELRRVTLFSEPEDGDYTRAVWGRYGKPIALPEPFGFELDTSELC